MDRTFTANPDVVFKRLEDRMVLVHLTTNQIFELNDTGARVWELLQAGTAPAELADRLADEFDADPETLHGEVETLLAELAAAGLATL